MTDENFFEALRAFCMRKPFRPFFIQLLTGERLFVAHPEAVYRRKNLVVYLTPLKQHHLFDSSTVCRILDPRRD